jgi:DNA-binding response OmpR family regulator
MPKPLLYFGGPLTARALAREQVDAIDAGSRAGLLALVRDGRSDLLLVECPPADESLIRAVAAHPAAPHVIALADPRQAAPLLVAGALAVLPVPAEPAAIAAQLRAVRRALPVVEEPMQVGDVRIEPALREVFVKGRAVHLPPTEYRIVEYLARNAGRTVPAAELALVATGATLTETEAMQILKVHVYRLRKHLQEAGAEGSIVRNVRSFGYVVDAPVQVISIAGRRTA